MSKYYAVKVGKIPGIYRTWTDCKKQISGFSGALYKSFKIKEEAENFIFTAIKLPNKFNRIIDIYTDGSHQPTKNFLGLGAYCKYEGKEYHLSVTCDKQYLATYDITETKCSNPTAEFLGFTEVLRYFVGVSGYCLHFYIDYEGVERWVKGECKCNEKYIKKIKTVSEKLIIDIDCEILFHHVDGHSGNEGNDEADLLAKSFEESSNFSSLIKILDKK